MSRRRRPERFAAEGSRIAAVGDRKMESQDKSPNRAVQQVRSGGTQKSHVSGLKKEILHRQCPIMFETLPAVALGAASG